MRSGAHVVIAQRAPNAPALPGEIPNLSAENTPDARRALREAASLFTLTPLRAFVAAAAAREGISNVKFKRQLERKLGLGARVLDRWESAGIPTTGNKRNVAAIEELDSIMAAERPLT